MSDYRHLVQISVYMMLTLAIAFAILKTSISTCRYISIGNTSGDTLSLNFTCRYISIGNTSGDSEQYGSVETPMEARSLRTTRSGIRAMDYPQRVLSCLGHRPLQDHLSSVLLERRNSNSRLGISRGAKVEASYNTSSLACLRLHLRHYPPTLSTSREVTTQNIAKT